MPNDRFQRLQHAFETAIAAFAKGRHKHLVSWNKDTGVFTIAPDRLVIWGIYTLSVFCILAAIACLSLMVLLPVSEGDRAFLAVFMPMMSAFFFGVGLFTLAQAKVSGSVSLDIDSKAVHLQNIGLFQQQDIAAITLRRNVWTERYRSQVINTIRDEDLKSATVGIRFRKHIFLNFKDIGLLTLRDVQAARALQQALGDMYACPLIER